MAYFRGNNLQPAGRYWLPWLWVTSIVFAVLGGFFLGNLDTPPKFLAAIADTANGIFQTEGEEFRDAIDLDTFTPVSTQKEPDRIVTGALRSETKSVVPGVDESPEQVSSVLVVETSVPPKQCLYETTLEPGGKSILISEVAWMGGLATEGLTANDEWIELFNPLDEEVDISGWQIVDRDAQIHITLTKGMVIAPGEFLLLERTDDESVPGVMADTLYAGNLANENEGLRLFDGDCILMDEVLADPDWPAGDAKNRRTMERGDTLSWHTYSGPLNGSVLGSPRGTNSKAIYKPVVEEEKQKEQKKEEVTPKQSGGGVSPTAEVFTPCPRNASTTPTLSVLINEVAWAGTASSSFEEWLELKNATTTSISLDGWQLEDEAGEIQVILSGSIEEFFLLRRILGSDDPDGQYEVGGAIADQVYTGTLQNSDEALYLFDASCGLVDEVDDVGTDWQNVGGSASPDYRTAERTATDTWQTYLGEDISDVMGTPRAENSTSTIEEDVGVEEPAEESPDDEEETEIEEEPADEEEPEESDEEILVDLTIGEIIFDPDGSDEGQERVVITNQGEQDVPLETYSLQYLKGGGDFADIKKKNFESGNMILVGGSFTVGMNCSGAVPCEGVNMSWSQALGNESGSVYVVYNQESLVGADDVDILTQKDYAATPSEPPS